jgi:hypothetical protein
MIAGDHPIVTAQLRKHLPHGNGATVCWREPAPEF